MSQVEKEMRHEEKKEKKENKENEKNESSKMSESTESTESSESDKSRESRERMERTERSDRTENDANSGNVLDWKRHRERFAEGLRYSAQRMGPFFRTSLELDALQIKAVGDSKTLQEYGWKTQWYNYTREFGYPERVLVDERDLLRQTHMNIDLSGSVLFHYSMMAASAEMCCSFNLYVCSVLPPALDPERKSLMSLVTGGFATRDDSWHAWPAEWMDRVRYDRWSPSEFVLAASGPHLDVRFGSPSAMSFRLTVAHGEEQVNLELQGRAPPRFLQTNGDVHNNNVQSYVFADMVGTLNTERTLQSSCLGFVQHSQLLPPPTNAIAQVRFLMQPQLRPRAYKPMTTTMTLLIQFPEYQYLFALAVPKKNLEAGTLITELVQGRAMSFGNVEPVAHVQVLIASSVQLLERDFPHSLDVMVQENALTTIDSCFYTSRTSVGQEDFQLLLRMRDVRNTVGFAVLRIPNVLQPELWSRRTFEGVVDMDFPSSVTHFTDLLLNQPLAKNWSLVQFVYACPWLLVILGVCAIITIAVCVVLTRRQRK